VIFFHHEEADPTSVTKETTLRKLAARFDVTGDPAHVGFLVLAPQGRALFGGKRGLVFDAEYTGDDGVDVATVDHFVDEVGKTGLVDRSRVYTMGASRGGQMAIHYAMLRSDRIAAFASFAAEPPPASWSCPGPPPPGAVVYRACDAIASCTSIELWLREREAASADTRWLRLGAADGEEPSCAVRNKCTALQGGLHHRRWPRGREDDMLEFLAHHAVADAAPHGSSKEAR
jgi:pimeloyl-ACP methyl ester carboxylesterase